MIQNDTVENTTQQVVPNPTGKGGFGDHPENRNPGGWNPKMTFSYQYRRFLNMNVEEFKAWKDVVPDTEKTMVEELAYSAVLKARSNSDERKEIANRTEGMPKQPISIDPTDSELVKEKLKEINDKLAKPVVANT